MPASYILQSLKCPGVVWVNQSTCVGFMVGRNFIIGNSVYIIAENKFFSDEHKKNRTGQDETGKANRG